MYLPKMILILLVVAAPSLSLQAEDAARHVRIVDYPDFPEGHSSWGSIGICHKYQKVFVGVTNHRNRIGLFEYDLKTKKMGLCGFVATLANLRDFQWQGKIHSQIVEGPDGGMYLTTDGGESREEYLMEHPRGYSGGYFLKWDPASRTMSNLGMGLQYESLKDLTVNPHSGEICAVSYPQVHFLSYLPSQNLWRDLGRLGSDHVPRVLFNDQWGNCYYVDWRQRLVKYDSQTKQLQFARESLPAFSGTPGEYIITGITAYAKDAEAGIIYLITYGAKMLAFHPTRDGIGAVEDLGGIFDGSQKPAWNYYCPNLARGKNGKLYYFIGGHGMYANQGGTIVLVEFDPAQKTKRIVSTFPLTAISEVTGSDVIDDQGNLYYAGRRSDPAAEARGESGASRPFMIIFNPEKELK